MNNPTCAKSHGKIWEILLHVVIEMIQVDILLSNPLIKIFYY